MDNTVTTTPAYGSVDYYAGKLRDCAHRWTDLRLAGFEFIRAVTDNGGDAERVANIVAAVEQVCTELGRPR